VAEGGDPRRYPGDIATIEAEVSVEHTRQAWLQMKSEMQEDR